MAYILFIVAAFLLFLWMPYLKCKLAFFKPKKEVIKNFLIVTLIAIIAALSLAISNIYFSEKQIWVREHIVFFDDGTVGYYGNVMDDGFTLLC